jgi:glycosyltransferase involved in cell wall biosynthesis
LISNSQTIADRIKKFYGRDVHAVIPPPVRTKLWNDVERISEDEGLLYWGRLIEYKKVDLLIGAVRKTGHKLNIVGSGPQEAELRTLASGMTNVVFHGRLSDEALKRLMGRSRAVLFAAYEDFGIVPVEAMAAGLPVVTYGVGGAAESVLPAFGVHFPLQTAESVAEGIQALEGRTFDPEALKAHAAQYDVDVFRQKYANTVSECLRISGKSA